MILRIVKTRRRQSKNAKADDYCKRERAALVACTVHVVLFQALSARIEPTFDQLAVKPGRLRKRLALAQTVPAACTSRFRQDCWNFLADALPVNSGSTGQ